RYPWAIAIPKSVFAVEGARGVSSPSRVARSNSLMTSHGRQIFVHGVYAERQLRNTLSNLLVGLILNPDVVWLVSPWVSDFDLLDNRTSDWNSVNPAWGARYVQFSELLAAATDTGSRL